MSTHLVIPDTQIKPNVPLDHCKWIGRYITEITPNKIIHLGDHFDLHSLSSYDRGKLASEGARYIEDINVGIDALEMIVGPSRTKAKRQHINKKKVWKSDWHFLLGNHEQRLERFVNDNPILQGKLSYDDFHLEEMGWKVHNFLEICHLDGVAYSHFFANPMTGKPYGGMMETRIKNIGFSFTQGHQQTRKVGERELADGTIQRGLVVGACYLHNEAYKGPQGNSHWRGLIVKHEVHNGNYDLMEVSLDYLCRKYEQMPVKKFLKQKYDIAWTAR